MIDLTPKNSACTANENDVEAMAKKKLTEIAKLLARISAKRDYYEVIQKNQNKDGSK